MEDTIERTAPIAMPLSQWFVIGGGILVVAVPWWIGLLWIIGLLQ